MKFFRENPYIICWLKHLNYLLFKEASICNILLWKQETKRWREKKGEGMPRGDAPNWPTLAEGIAWPKLAAVTVY